MNGNEIADFVRAEKGASFALCRDNGMTASVVVRSREGESANDVGARFWHRAESYVDETGLGGKFTVVASDADTGRVLDTLPIVFEGNEIEHVAPLGPQPMTPDFALRHSIKAVEARDVSSRKLMAELHAEYRRDLASKARRIETLEAKIDSMFQERVRTIEAIESLKSQAHARRLNQIEAETNAKQQGWIFEKVVEHMPIIIGALTGSTKAHKFVKSLEPEKRKVLEAAMSSLSPEQVSMFNELMHIGEKADSATKRLSAAGSDEHVAAE